MGVTLPATPSALFGYAVPAEVAEDVAGQLIANGRVTHPWLGVEGSDRGLSEGAVVQRVRPSGPAAAAGVVDGDVVVEINGVATPSMGMLLLGLRSHHPGETIRLMVVRGSRRLEIPVTLSERP